MGKALFGSLIFSSFNTRARSALGTSLAAGALLSLGSLSAQAQSLNLECRETPSKVEGVTNRCCQIASKDLESEENIGLDLLKNRSHFAKACNEKKGQIVVKNESCEVDFNIEKKGSFKGNLIAECQVAEQAPSQEAPRTQETAGSCIPPATGSAPSIGATSEAIATALHFSFENRAAYCATGLGFKLNPNYDRSKPWNYSLKHAEREKKVRQLTADYLDGLIAVNAMFTKNEFLAKNFDRAKYEAAKKDYIDPLPFVRVPQGSSEEVRNKLLAQRKENEEKNAAFRRFIAVLFLKENGNLLSHLYDIEARMRSKPELANSAVVIDWWSVPGKTLFTNYENTQIKNIDIYEACMGSKKEATSPEVDAILKDKFAKRGEMGPTTLEYNDGPEPR